MADGGKINVAKVTSIDNSVIDDIIGSPPVLDTNFMYMTLIGCSLINTVIVHTEESVTHHDCIQNSVIKDGPRIGKWQKELYNLDNLLLNWDAISVDEITDYFWQRSLLKYDVENGKNDCKIQNG